MAAIEPASLLELSACCWTSVRSSDIFVSIELCISRWPWSNWLESASSSTISLAPEHGGVGETSAPPSAPATTATPAERIHCLRMENPLAKCFKALGGRPERANKQHRILRRTL